MGSNECFEEGAARELQGSARCKAHEGRLEKLRRFLNRPRRMDFSGFGVIGTLTDVLPVRIVRLFDRPAAVDIVARWHFDEWGTEPEEVGLEAYRHRLASWATEGGIPCAYLAVVDDEVCGSACLVDHDMSDPPEGAQDLRPWLSGVYVKPQRRHSGLGRRLVEAVEDAASVLGHPQLFLYTAPVTAGQFYAPMGWQEILAPTYEGREVVIMQKALGGN